MGALQAAQRPRSASQLSTGMFCQAAMGVLQWGQAERGTTRLKRSGAGAAGWATTVVAVEEVNSAAWARHSRSSITGRR